MTSTNSQSCQVTSNVISGGDKNTIVTALIDSESDNNMLLLSSDKNNLRSKEIHSK